MAYFRKEEWVTGLKKVYKMSTAEKLNIEFDTEKQIKEREEREKLKKQQNKKSINLDYNIDLGELEKPTTPPPHKEQPKVVENVIKKIPEIKSIKPQYKLGDYLNNIISNTPVLMVEMEAKIKLAITEQLIPLIANYAQNLKSLEHNVNEIIKQIYIKAPNVKNELTSIKKLLSHHSNVDNIYNTENKAKENISSTTSNPKPTTLKTIKNTNIKKAS